MIWRGIAIGIIISAPMGPVGILCVQRTLEKGRRTGFFTGIGAAISDMIYCLLTGFCLSFIEEFLTRNHNILQLIGSVVLIGFGVYLFKSNPTRNLKKPEEEGISDGRNILNGFLFTFSNPLIIFLIIGLFARFNFFMPEIKFYHYMIGFISIGAGALLWWWLVTFLVAKLRAHFNLRSMWLVNKIIGGIIFIFAIAGIVSAVSAMCEAAPRGNPPAKIENEYMNRSRGFSGFGNGNDSTLIITASTPDTICNLIPLRGGGRFDFSFRAANLHNGSGKRYNIEGGKKIAHPGWGIVITGADGDRETISIFTDDHPKDETYSPTALCFKAGRSEKRVRIDSGIDFFTGRNAFLLSFDRGEATLMGGNREYKPILSWDAGIAHADSIGFFVAPGGAVDFDNIALEYPEGSFIERSEYGNAAILESYLRRSSDEMEGMWRIYDRSLDEDNLRMGGDYIFAIVKSPEGYDLIYLMGAETRKEDWAPGMIKGKLIDSGFEGVWDVEWYDATGALLSKDIKASYEEPLISIQFPYHSSSIRLRKIIRKEKH